MTDLTPQKSDSIQTLLAKLVQSKNTQTSEVALASATRTATTQSLDIDMEGYAGMTISLLISAASGTGGLSIRVRFYEPISGNYLNCATWGTPVTTATPQAMQVGRSLSIPSTSIAAFNQGVAPTLMANIMRVEIVHSDASNYTYAVNIIKHQS